MAKRLDIPDEAMIKIRELLKEKNESKFWSYRLSFAGIAEAAGVSAYTVQSISYHRRMEPNRPKRERLTNTEVEKVKKILLDKDFGRIKINYKQISDMLGISYFTVRNIHNGLIYNK